MLFIGLSLRAIGASAILIKLSPWTSRSCPQRLHTVESTANSPLANLHTQQTYMKSNGHKSGELESFLCLKNMHATRTEFGGKWPSTKRIRPKKKKLKLKLLLFDLIKILIKMSDGFFAPSGDQEASFWTALRQSAQCPNEPKNAWCSCLVTKLDPLCQIKLNTNCAYWTCIKPFATSEKIKITR